ncbi:MAG: hypothetical protein BWK79_11105 [Beggiatoa sp. IS2]|nr:MAG: hypothetical protein BWK79_11105 [Beggiatoa sp. IS2]
MNLPAKHNGKKPIKVTAIRQYGLQLLFEDQREYQLDLTSLITQKTIFWRLKNFRYFQKVSIDPLGGLCWPEGEDIAPEKVLQYITPFINSPG